MARSAVAALGVVASQASQLPHEFFAERNFICETTKYCPPSFPTDDEPLQSHASIVKQVNEDNEAPWQAAPNARFEGMTLGEVKRMMGTIVDPNFAITLPERKPPSVQADSLPTNFDAREKWPQCASVIGHIRDQANCGSCWAHGTTEAFNDRLCITTGSTDLLSVSDTTGCCGFLKCFSMGCNGGQISSPYNWFHSTGVVSGGDYGSDEFCYDYTMPKCAHHVTDPKLPACDKVTKVAPQCKSSCASNTSIDYSHDKRTMAGAGYSVSCSTIKQDLFENGPITAAFTVYEDFLTYKSGVFVHKTGSALGGHAVKVLGYGHDDESGLDYLLVANSWNDEWGDKGLFKIQCEDMNQFAAGHVTGGNQIVV